MKNLRKALQWDKDCSSSKKQNRLSGVEFKDASLDEEKLAFLYRAISY